MINKTARYCLFFDYDGTLSCNGVSEENKAALKKLHELGHYLFLNTGRSKGFIPEEAFAAADWDGIIAGTSYIEYKNTVLCNQGISKEALIQAKRFYDAHKIPCLFEGVKTNYAIGKLEGICNITDGFETYLDQNYDKMEITKWTFCQNISSYEDAHFPAIFIILLIQKPFRKGSTKQRESDYYARNLGLRVNIRSPSATAKTTLKCFSTPESASS